MNQDTEKKVSIRKNIRDILIIIVIGIVFLSLIEIFIIQPVRMKQASMYPTIKQNEIWLIDKWSKTTKQNITNGEIVMFEAPSEKYISDENGLIAKYDKKTSEKLIKRVIAISGEHIQIKDNRVYINDKEIKEEYLYEQNSTEDSGLYPYYFLDLIVPENCIFVMGDNREDSVDSRSFGCIPINKVKGKVSNKIYPFDGKYTREDLVKILKHKKDKRNFKMRISMKDGIRGDIIQEYTVWAKDNIVKVQNINSNISWNDYNRIISKNEGTIYESYLKKVGTVSNFWKAPIQDRSDDITETDYSFKYLSEDKDCIIFELNWCNEEETAKYSKIKLWADKNLGEILKLELYSEEDKYPVYIVEYELQTDIITDKDLEVPDDYNRITY